MSNIFKNGGGAGIGSYVIVFKDGQLAPDTDPLKLWGAYESGEQVYISVIDEETQDALVPASGWIDADSKLHLVARDFDDDKTYSVVLEYAPIASEMHIEGDVEEGITGGGVSKEEVEEMIADKADLVNGKVPAEQLPSYVDDILEFPTLDDFPNPGEEGKIYVALDTGYTYRWSGSEYTQVGGSEVDLSDYYRKEEINELLEDKADVSELRDAEDDIAALEADVALKANAADSVEVIPYQNQTPLTQEQINKALAGKLAILHNGRVYVPHYHSEAMVNFHCFEIGHNISDSENVAETMRSMEYVIILLIETGMLSDSGPMPVSSIGDYANNYLAMTDAPAADGKRLIREGNLVANYYDKTAIDDSLATKADKPTDVLESWVVPADGDTLEEIILAQPMTPDQWWDFLPDRTYKEFHDIAGNRYIFYSVGKATWDFYFYPVCHMALLDTMVPIDSARMRMSIEADEETGDLQLIFGDEQSVNLISLSDYLEDVEELVNQNKILIAPLIVDEQTEHGMRGHVNNKAAALLLENPERPVYFQLNGLLVSPQTKLVDNGLEYNVMTGGPEDTSYLNVIVSEESNSWELTMSYGIGTLTNGLVDAQNDITALQDNVTELQGNVTELQEALPLNVDASGTVAELTGEILGHGVFQEVQPPEEGPFTPTAYCEYYNSNNEQVWYMQMLEGVYNQFLSTLIETVPSSITIRNDDADWAKLQLTSFKSDVRVAESDYITNTYVYSGIFTDNTARMQYSITLRLVSNNGQSLSSDIISTPILKPSQVESLVQSAIGDVLNTDF